MLLLVVQGAVIALHSTICVNVALIDSAIFIRFANATIAVAQVMATISNGATSGSFILESQTTDGATAMQWCCQRCSRTIDAIDFDVAFR